ncbi:MAG: type II toxin-antitoxin system RelE/ParE family toxin [Acidobacteria bacterium]|nr:type II toxin-antitoxin system RelE/ParE family toxin [Acidobacteriota bacterium]
MTYRVVIEPAALKMLANITDRRVQEKIRDRIDGLAQEPEKQGKPLTGELTGYRSIRAVGQRYRIIYEVRADKVLVLLVALGIRREKGKQDIYTLARKILRLRLWKPPGRR